MKDTTMPPNDENGWSKFGKLVLSELDRNHEDHKEMFQVLNALNTNVALLKFKAGLIASVIALVVSGVVAFVMSRVLAGGG